MSGKMKYMKDQKSTPKRRPTRRKRRRRPEQVHQIRDFVIPLDDVEQLAKKYRGKYKLNLTAPNGQVCTRKSNRCSMFESLEEKLLAWEEELNERCKHEPIIRVENLVDDCLPPQNFKFILESFARKDISQMFDSQYLVGCKCTRCTPKVGAIHVFGYMQWRR